MVQKDEETPRVGREGSVSLTVIPAKDCLFQVADESGHLVDGPFATNAEAWRALERLVGEHKIPAKAKPRLPGRRKAKGKAKSKASKKMSPKEERTFQKAAAKAPGWLRTGAAANFDPNADRVYRDYKLGTFGAASPVRKIDPAVYLAEKAARGDH
jgi:hypothetical protein